METYVPLTELRFLQEPMVSRWEKPTEVICLEAMVFILDISYLYMIHHQLNKHWHAVYCLWLLSQIPAIPYLHRMSEENTLGQQFRRFKRTFDILW